MFKVEPFITPYITSYLARFIKDFNTDRFQVSFWQGDATFENVVLNLEALEASMRLPAVALLNGTIHKLKINVPWTKITSEPIVVSINTLEIIATLKTPEETAACIACNYPPEQVLLEKQKALEEEPPPTFMQHLTNKILQNVVFVFENVVLKYTENDTVLSLNIRKAASRCVNNKWEPAFIELAEPEYILRKCWNINDLTICLDRTSYDGKIDIFTEPLLYRCTFDVRILYQFHGPYVKYPYFARYDVYLGNMNFSILDEHIAMLLKFYNLITYLSLIDNYGGKSAPPSRTTSDEAFEECTGEGSGDNKAGWGSWAASWLPTIPEAIFGPVDESIEPLPECEFSVPVTHCGVYVDVANIHFKTVERSRDKAYLKSKIKFLPFLKFSMQGIAMDLIFRGLDTSLKLGLSEFVISRDGNCPCGIVDSQNPNELNDKNNTHIFLQVGKVHEDFSSQSMFNPYFLTIGETRPPVDYHFKLEGHNEEYTEEKMLERTPGIALDILELDLYPLPEDQDSESYDLSSSLKKPYYTCRFIAAPVKVTLCSSAIHRAKLIAYSLTFYDESNYKHLKDLVYLNTSKDNHLLHTIFGRSIFTFQFTILRPQIEIFAGDHPDYDKNSHIRASRSNRKAVTLTPLPEHFRKWPKMTIRCDTIDGRFTEPTIMFRRLVEFYEGDELENPDVISAYTYKITVSIDNLEVHLNDGNSNFQLFQPMSATGFYEEHLRPSMQSSNDVPLKVIKIGLDSVKLQITKPNLVLCQIIVTSCYNELVEVLGNASLYTNLPTYQPTLILQLVQANFMCSITNTLVFHHISVHSAAIFIEGPQSRHVSLFEAPYASMPSKDTNNKEGKFIELYVQYPKGLWDNSMLPSPLTPPLDMQNNKSTDESGPIFAVAVGTFKVEFDFRVLDWLTFAPIPLSTVINRNNLSSQSLYPIVPLSKKRIDVLSSRSSDQGGQAGTHSSASQGTRTQTYSGIFELFKSQASTRKSRLSRSVSYKSAFEIPQYQTNSKPPKDLNNLQTFIENWEAWATTSLSIIRKSFITVEIDQGYLRFPVGNPSNGADDYFVIQTPKLSAHPDTPNAKTFLEESIFLRKFPLNVRDITLFPIRILLNSIHGFSTHHTADNLTIIPPFSVGLTFNMKPDSQSSFSVTVHCDVPPVKLILTTFQIKLLTQLIEKTFHSIVLLLKLSPSLFLSKKDITFDSIVSEEYDEEYEKRSSSGKTSWYTPKPVITQRASLSEITNVINESPQDSTVEVFQDEHKTASFWIQFTTAQFQMILRDGESGNCSENQIVFDIEDIASSIDVRNEYTKIMLKIGSMSARCYERKDNEWSTGKNLGIIISCGDEITRNIDIIGSNYVNDDSGKSEDDAQPPSSKRHGLIFLTFTRVESMNFHKKSEVMTPTERWNTLITKHYNFYSENGIKKRMLNEFDIKIQPLDILFCPDVFVPYKSMLKTILSVNIPTEIWPRNSNLEQGNRQLIPRYNNNSLPMLYLEMEMLRIFMKNENEETLSNYPDVLLFQMSSISLVSQSENPLQRFIIKPDVYMLAEQTFILQIPGSPVEDRQYQLDVREFSIVSCYWKDVERNSRRVFNRSSVLLRAMGENPAFEWNKMKESDQNFEEVEAHLLLDRVDISSAYAPPIVFERIPCSEHSSILVAGQVYELNIPNNLIISLSDRQLSSIINLSKSCQEFWRDCINIPASNLKSPQHTPNISPAKRKEHLRKCSSGSIISSSTENDSGIDSSKKMESKLEHANNTAMLIPTDILLLCSFVEIKLYEIEPMREKSNPKSLTLFPLVYLSFAQPHWIARQKPFTQSLEISTFDLCLGIGTKSLSSSHEFILPQKDDYSLKPFRSILNKNTKTGMGNPYCTFTLIDPLLPTCKMFLDIHQPIKMVITQEAIDICRHVAEKLKGRYEDLVSIMAPRDINDDSTISRLKKIFLNATELGFNLDQVILSIKVYPTCLVSAGLSFGISSMTFLVSNAKKDCRSIEGSLNGLNISSKLRDKSNLMVNPWNLKFKIISDWYTGHCSPFTSVTIGTEPLTMYIGPQNILAALQVFHSFSGFFKSQGEFLETTNAEFRATKPQEFHDDLRAGAFKYISQVQSGVPEIYQALFCESQRSMTWRYPQPRYLSRLEAFPVPFSSNLSQEYKFVVCKVECFDDTENQFIEFRKFRLSESSEVKVDLPGKDSVHKYVSYFWRITMSTGLEGNEASDIRSEILAACLRVDSVFDPLVVKTLNLQFDIPRTTCHFVNHLTFAGQVQEDKLSSYCYYGLPIKEQTFATVELSSTVLKLHLWKQLANCSLMSYLKCDIVDYAFLTESAFVEPFNFQVKLRSNESGLSEVDFASKPIFIKTGGATLHTLGSSILTWNQVLSAYTGDHVDLSLSHDKPLIILEQIVLCNDTTSTIQVCQDGTSTSINLLMRQCYGFNWTSSRSAGECKVRLNVEERWSLPFGLKTSGYKARKLANNIPIFINVSSLSPSQTMVKLSGPLIIANALDESLDVSIIPEFDGRETNCTVGGHSHSPTHIISIYDSMQFKFKVSSTIGQSSQWSSPVSLNEIRRSTSRAVAVSLTVSTNERPTPITYNVWCAVVEEKIGQYERIMIVTCPFFRVKSTLAAPTLAHVSTGRSERESSLLLEGKGSDIQIDFVGPQDATLHLTFQNRETSRSRQSRPTIPLNPYGPAMENRLIARPIDEVLDKILTYSLTGKLWPFIEENIPLEDWVLSNSHPERDVKVEFIPWIEGLPSLMIDAKPSSLFINLTGKPLLFAEFSSDNEMVVQEIPATFVFTPIDVKGLFKFGFCIGGNAFWTESLEFTEQKSRTDIHFVNTNWKIPIDCFSRLEIYGKKEVFYVSLDVHTCNGILIMSLKPTYSVQNRMDIPIVLKALSLSPSSIPKEEDLELQKDSFTLAPDPLNPSRTECLPLFHTVFEKPPLANIAEVKYLALRCGSGPFWFVQLTRFEVIFNNMASTKGIPSGRLALSLQNCQAQWTVGSDEKFEEVTTPVTMSWICKNGQVWISISLDEFPQVMLFNESEEPFIFAESDERLHSPFKDTDHFTQFLMLPQNSIGYFTLPSTSARFPEMCPREPRTTILIGKCFNKQTKSPKLSSAFYDSPPLEWSNEISLNDLNTIRSFQVDDGERIEHYQIKVEQIGSTFYIYIQDMPASQISAKEIRQRLSASHLSGDNPLRKNDGKRSRNKNPIQNNTTGDCEVTVQEVWMKDELIITSLPLQPFFSSTFKLFLPLVRLILTDDFTHTHDRKEMLGVTLQDLFINISSGKHGTPLRILHDRSEEHMIITVCLGDLQVDNALYEEKLYDFPVIVRREKDYNTFDRISLPFDTLCELYENVGKEDNFLMELSISFGLANAFDDKGRLQTLWLQFKSFAMYFEDGFIDFMKPTLHGLMAIVHDRVRLMELKPTSCPPKVIHPKPINLRSGDQSSLSSAKATTSSSHESFFANTASKIVNSVFETIVEGDSLNTSTKPEIPSVTQRSLPVPVEILSVISEFSNPIRLKQITVKPVTVYMTLRISKTLYLAVDHSPLELAPFEARSVITTNLAFGQAMSIHYLQGAIFGSTNPVRLLGSLELLGSPGTLARSVTTGLKDFIVYPMRGIVEGPTGFLTGFTYGFSSLLTNIGSGTLTSVTNLAWSVSRNLDRFTLNEEEQLQREEDRRVPIDGVGDGFRHGLSGFGIRLLGAIGGIAHEPMNSVIENGASPLRLLRGLAKGMVGVVTKPIAGTVELVAMTGQGILTGVGWTPKLQRKHGRINENVNCCCNSLLKYRWMLTREKDEERRVLYLFNASQFRSSFSASESTPVTILLTTESLYVISLHDEIIHEIPITSIVVENTEDSSIVAIRPAPRNMSETTSLAEERLIEFVHGVSHSNIASSTTITNGSSSSESVKTILEPYTEIESNESSALSSESSLQTQNFNCFDICVDPNSKLEFVNIFKLAQEQKNGKIFPIF